MSTASDVRNITGSDLCDGKIQPFIDVAKILIAKIVDDEIPTSTRDLACGWLAAHNLSLSPIGDELTQVTREKIGNEMDTTYARQTISGVGIMATDYGQTANQLMDSKLAELDKRPISIGVIGEAYA